MDIVLWECVVLQAQREREELERVHRAQLAQMQSDQEALRALDVASLVRKFPCISLLAQMLTLCNLPWSFVFNTPAARLESSYTY